MLPTLTEKNGVLPRDSTVNICYNLDPLIIITLYDYVYDGLDHNNVTLRVV